MVARRDEANGHTDVALAFYRQRRFDEAAAEIEKALAFYQDVLRADPRNSQAQRDVSWSLSFMAELAAARGKLEEALAYQRRSLAIDEVISQASANGFQARKEVAESWSAVGDFLGRLGRLEPALEAGRTSITMFEQLLASNPSHLRLQQLLAAQYGRQGHVVERVAARRTGGGGRAPSREACQLFAKSLALWKDLEAKSAVDADNRSQPADMQKAVARCDAASPSWTLVKGPGTP
jgi:tetratricopeptide (TPR) repeat protein